MSGFIYQTEELLIQPSKTQRLNILEEEYLMKEIALEKATDLINLLSDELDSVKQSSFEIIEDLKHKLQKQQSRNQQLQLKVKQLDELICGKESRIVGMPPLSRRSLSQSKQQTQVKQQLVKYSGNQMVFLRSLVSTLMNKVFSTHKEVEYILESELPKIEELHDSIQQYKVQQEGIEQMTDHNSPVSKEELFSIISQQQKIILRLKSHISGIESCLTPLDQPSETLDQTWNLTQQLRMLLDIVTKCLRNKSVSTKSTEMARYPRHKENDSPVEMISKIESLLSRERFLVNQNRELKGIIQGLIAHMKR